MNLVVANGPIVNLEDPNEPNGTKMNLVDLNGHNASQWTHSEQLVVLIRRNRPIVSLVIPYRPNLSQWTPNEPCASKWTRSETGICKWT